MERNQPITDLVSQVRNSTQEKAEEAVQQFVDTAVEQYQGNLYRGAQREDSKSPEEVVKEALQTYVQQKAPEYSWAIESHYGMEITGKSTP